MLTDSDLQALWLTVRLVGTVTGAPFDALLAADTETQTKLVKKGQAVNGSQFTYAIGKLALWSAQSGGRGLAGLSEKRRGESRDPRLRLRILLIGSVKRPR